MLSDFLDFFWPRTCHICGTILHDGEDSLCSHCVETLPRSLYHTMPDPNPMERRFAGLVPFVRGTGHFIYSRNSGLASAIHDMKYRRFPSIGRRLGEIVGGELKMAGFFDGADMVAAVPMHWRKRARRGYNQADFIAGGLAEATGLSIYKGIKAVRAHRTQTAMTLEERQKNLTGSFAVADPDALAGKGLVLVDDVCTTGSTLLALATAVTSASPSCRLYLLSLCVTV